MKIKISGLQSIKNFINIANKYPFDIILKSNKYVVDAKSIMGVFSLDLSKPVSVEIIGECPNKEQFLEEIKIYQV